MKHRHPGPKVQYTTRRGNIRYRQRPTHVQTLIFPKNKFNRKRALDWAKDHGFQHSTSREEGNTIRVRQFPPSEIKRVGGTFPMGKDVKGLYVDRKETKRGSRRHTQSLFHAGNEPPSEKIKRGEAVYGFSSPEFAEAWAEKQGYDNIYQFQTDDYDLDEKQYLRDKDGEKVYSDNEFIAMDVLDEEEI